MYIRRALGYIVLRLSILCVNLLRILGSECKMGGVVKELKFIRLRITESIAGKVKRKHGKHCVRK